MPCHAVPSHFLSLPMRDLALLFTTLPLQLNLRFTSPLLRSSIQSLCSTSPGWTMPLHIIPCKSAAPRYLSFASPGQSLPCFSIALPFSTTPLLFQTVLISTMPLLCSADPRRCYTHRRSAIAALFPTMPMHFPSMHFRSDTSLNNAPAYSSPYLSINHAIPTPKPINPPIKAAMMINKIHNPKLISGAPS